MLRTTITTTASWIVACVAVLMSMQASARPESNLGYDPQADPFEQYHQAIEIAQRDNKLVLVIAGGDWCSWCYVLDRFVKEDAEVERRLNDAFVVMKVYVGFDNYNDTFFSQLPQAKGAPHFWIISPEKDVLSSLSTGSLEAGKRGYDKQAFLRFIDEWKARGAVFSGTQQAPTARRETAERAAGL
jgi:hypothetical protein